MNHSSDILLAFATERDRLVLASSPRPPDRTSALIAREWDGRCFHCGKPGMTLAPIVPHVAGGPLRAPNLVFSCRACHKLRQHGDLDALELLGDCEGSQRERALRQREDALMICSQHPVPPAARRSLADCRAHLSDTRWIYPRVPLLISAHDDVVLLAPLQIPTGPATDRLLDEVRGASGRRASDGIWTVHRKDWDALAWRLIDLHAVLRSVSPHAQARATWKDSWDVLFDDVHDVRRNAPRKPHRGFTSFRSRGERTRQGAGA
jgi:hypothetical protein